MAASIKIEFDDGSKVMQRTLNVHDSATPAGKNVMQKDK